MALGTMNRDGSLARSSQMDSRSLRGSPADCGARSKTPPGTPKKAGKLVGVRVLMLGYNVATPNPSDNISKDYVFKLQFKNHVYFFRAESQFTFDRWLEVLSSATKSEDNAGGFIVNGTH